MTEFKASRPRMAGQSVTAAFCLGVAAFGNDFGPVQRTIGAALGLGILVVVVVMARTRIVVTDDEIAIRRGFGRWFRAEPRSVTVKWTPVVNGLVRSHGWALSVGRKQRTKEGVTVPLSSWRPATVEALRARLSEVTGSADA